MADFIVRVEDEHGSVIYTVPVEGAEGPEDALLMAGDIAMEARMEARKEG